MSILLFKNVLVTVQVYYHIPDYQSIINEFIWQTLDITPEYPRINKFLKHWDTSINAKISRVDLSYTDPQSLRDYRYSHYEKLFN